MSGSTKASIVRIAFAALSMVAPAADARACSVEELRRSPGYVYRPERIAQFVDSADVIVRVRAVDGDSSSARPEVRFVAVEWIRGGPRADPLHAYGTLVEHDDFNAQPVPYTTVRPAGQRGNCFAAEYRRGAEYLLLLRPVAGALSPYWMPLAPVNEQVRGADDPWLEWVRTRVVSRRHDA